MKADLFTISFHIKKKKTVKNFIAKISLFEWDRKEKQRQSSVFIW